MRTEIKCKMLILVFFYKDYFHIVELFTLRLNSPNMLAKIDTKMDVIVKDNPMCVFFETHTYTRDRSHLYCWQLANFTMKLMSKIKCCGIETKSMFICLPSLETKLKHFENKKRKNVQPSLGQTLDK